jgi:flagellar hook-basal body complex protein FliE
MSDPLGLISNAPSLGGAQQSSASKAQAQGGPSFKDVLMKNIEQVNKLQQDAEMAVEDLAAGRRDDYQGVMIAKAKADLAFKMLLQVRNKMIDAYEEVKQMRV